MAASDDDVPLKDILTSNLARGKHLDDCVEDSYEKNNEGSILFDDADYEFSEECENEHKEGGKNYNDDVSDDDSSDGRDNDDDDVCSDDDDDKIDESAKNKEHYIPKRRRSCTYGGRKIKFSKLTERGDEIDDNSTIRKIADECVSRKKVKMFNDKKEKTFNIGESSEKEIGPLTPLTKDKKCDEEIVGRQFKVREKRGKGFLTLPIITFFKDIKERGTLYNIKVLITRSWYGKLYSRSYSSSFTFVARDEEGSEREVITADSDADKWKHLIFINKVYVVKNVIHLMTTRPIKVVNTTWQLSLTKQSDIVELSEHEISVGPTYNFEKLNVVRTLALKTEYVHDILAYVVNVSHVRTISLKNGGTSKLVDVFVIDESYYDQPVRLTIWEDTLKKYMSMFGKGYVDNFLIIAIGLRAKIFKEKPQLETTNFTRIKFEAKGIPQAEQLMRWIQSKLSKQQVHYLGEGGSSSRNNADQTVKVCTIQELLNETQFYPPNEKPLNFIVYATVAYIYADKPWYDVCSQCKRSVKVQYGTDFTCINCGHTGTNSNKKYKVKARIEDKTDHTNIVAFDQDAETLLDRPLTDIILLYTSGEDAYEYERYLDKCASIAYKIKLRVTRENYKFIQTGGGFTVSSLERVFRQPHEASFPEPTPRDKQTNLLSFHDAYI